LRFRRAVPETQKASRTHANNGQRIAMTVNGVGYTPSVAAVMDRGKNAAAFDGMDLRAGGNLYWNGALRFVVGDGVSMGYDQNGNMSYKVDGSGASIYQYDHENRLESVTRNGALQESYLYDDSGQRVKKVSGNTAWYYPFPQYEVQVTTTTAATALASGAPYTLTEAGRLHPRRGSTCRRSAVGRSRLCTKESSAGSRSTQKKVT
jgi:hypothetical protein